MGSFAPGVVDGCVDGMCQVTLYDGQHTRVPAAECVPIPAPWSYVDMCADIHRCAASLVGRPAVALFDEDGFYYNVSACMLCRAHVAQAEVVRDNGHDHQYLVRYDNSDVEALQV